MMDPYQVAGMQPPQLNFPQMQMQPMRPNGQNQMTQALLAAALKGGGAPGQQQPPQPGQQMPGGAMNIAPGQRPQPGGLIGMLSGMFNKPGPQQVNQPSSADAIY